MANTATIRNSNGLPATFTGSKTGQDDAPLVFVKVGDEERRMRRAEWDALPLSVINRFHVVILESSNPSILARLLPSPASRRRSEVAKQR